MSANAQDHIVFIVDDDRRIRESLCDLLSTFDLRTVAFGTAAEYIAHARARRHTCFGSRDQDGERVAADRVDMPIIFVSGYGEVPMTVQTMNAGAMEFLTKPLVVEALYAIRHAVERSSTVLAEAKAIRSLRECHAALTCREREVMAWVVSGLLNKQIGAELDISEITVKAHRGSMCERCGQTRLRIS